MRARIRLDIITSDPDAPPLMDLLRYIDIVPYGDVYLAGYFGGVPVYGPTPLQAIMNWLVFYVKGLEKDGVIKMGPQSGIVEGIHYTKKAEDLTDE